MLYGAVAGGVCTLKRVGSLLFMDRCVRLAVTSGAVQYQHEAKGDPGKAMPIYRWMTECGYTRPAGRRGNEAIAMAAVFVFLPALGDSAAERWVTLASVMAGMEVVAPKLQLIY